MVGLVGGYAAAYALDPEPTTQGASTPVTAQSPSVPVDPIPTGNAQPSVPGLQTDLPMREGRMGSNRFRLVHPVPRGWAKIYSAPDEVKWKQAGNPDNTYLLRIEQVQSLNDTIDEVLTDRIDELRDEEERLTVLERTANTLEFTYVSEGFLRHGFLTWLDLRGTGFAEVEIAVTGREVDARGAQQLINRVAAGMRQT
ncbi:hypothetical protein ASG94_11435 [Nocardioides sp. Soil805]|nr:hypothetical protein ASG94_11435 [Nocardioides sp. Soil805]